MQKEQKKKNMKMICGCLWLACSAYYRTIWCQTSNNQSPPSAINSPGFTVICEVLPNQQHTWHAAAVVLSDQIGVVVGVYGVVVAQLDHLLKSVVNEDEADQGGEALLSEAREVLHQETGIGGNQQQAEQARPQANP